ncbi:hypothetical protein C5167_021154 [Papaver somniferum]|uniref:Uncharacterized protein n=1 Tax=Papaver somniferum TaxID=3469 RepID=A0A4Y7IZ85_PAPSO|nr:hypothetical protein C5167_021154 [Papaver somniferum]
MMKESLWLCVRASGELPSFFSSSSSPVRIHFDTPETFQSQDFSQLSSVCPMPGDIAEGEAGSCGMGEGGGGNGEGVGGVGGGAEDDVGVAIGGVEGGGIGTGTGVRGGANIGGDGLRAGACGGIGAGVGLGSGGVGTGAEAGFGVGAVKNESMLLQDKASPMVAVAPGSQPSLEVIHSQICISLYYS